MMKAICFTIGFALIFVHSTNGQTTANVRYVDPTIGSVGQILEPTRPAAYLPNNMIRVFPVRSDQLDDQIRFFPLTISSHRQPNLFSLMPYSGNIDAAAWRRPYTWYNETTTPYYYAVRLEETGDSIEFTPSARSG